MDKLAEPIASMLNTAGDAAEKGLTEIRKLLTYRNLSDY